MKKDIYGFNIRKGMHVYRIGGRGDAYAEIQKVRERKIELTGDRELPLHDVYIRDGCEYMRQNYIIVFHVKEGSITEQILKEFNYEMEA